MDLLGSISKTMLIRVIIILLGVIYGTLHHAGFHIPIGFNEALTVTLLLLLIEQFVEISNKLHKQGSKDSEIELFIKRDKSINGKLLNNLNQELKSAIKIDGNSLIIEHSIWALYSYVNYWEMLAEQQELLHGRALELQIIHSHEIGVWVNHPLTRRFLQEQKRFCENGGTITRILCAKGAVPDDKIKAAAKQMKDVGIKVRYFDISSTYVDHNFAWDFLRTVQNEHSVIWGDFGADEVGGAITQAVYLKASEYKSKDLKQLWSRIEKHSVEFTETTSGMELLRP